MYAPELNFFWQCEENLVRWHLRSITITITTVKFHHPSQQYVCSRNLRCLCCAGGELSQPLQGLTAVVLGTGGAARALAFGAAARGANVIVAGRRLERARDLAYTVTETCAEGTSATACAVEAVQKGELESMHVLMNTTPLGMVGERENQTPVPVEVLQKVSY